MKILDNKGILFRPLDPSIQISDPGKQGGIISWGFIFRNPTDVVSSLPNALCYAVKEAETDLGYYEGPVAGGHSGKTSA